METLLYEIGCLFIHATANIVSLLKIQSSKHQRLLLMIQILCMKNERERWCTNLAHPLKESNHRPAITFISNVVTSWETHQDTQKQLNTTIDGYENHIKLEHDWVGIWVTIFLKCFPAHTHTQNYQTRECKTTPKTGKYAKAIWKRTVQ